MGWSVTPPVFSLSDSRLVDMVHIRTTTLFVVLIFFLLILAHACDAVFAQEKVAERQPEQDFMLMVSMCVDDALWRENEPNTKQDGSAPSRNSSPVSSYLGRMKVCIEEWQSGVRFLAKVKPEDVEVK